MIRKYLIFIFSAFLLCGCTQNNTKEEITFSSWGSISEVKIIKKIISDFEEENPAIKINFMHIPQNYFQKLQLLFASNTPPDVLFINNLYLPVYEKELEDLTEFVNKEDFYRQAVSGLSYNDKILGIPRDISNLVFYVNTDIVPLPIPEWKIEDLIIASIMPEGSGIWGVSYEDTIYWALPYLTYFGGGILDKDGNLIINSEQSKKGIDFYKSLKKHYKIAPNKSQIGSSTLAQMFLDKKIIFYLSGRWMYPKISETADFNWAVINFPYGDKPLPADVSGWAIAKTSKHKDAAIKFVEYISSEKSSEYFTETGLIVPARIQAAQKLNDNEHNEKIFLEVIRKSENTPVRKDYNKILDKLNRELNL